jgi:preprotein translocase subunit SecG
MFAFLVVFIAIIALLMTVVVLLQSGRGGGLAGIASTGATRQVLGSRQAPDMLEKATWTLATIFILLCIASNFFIGTEAPESVIQQQAQSGQTQQQTLPPAQQNNQAAPAPMPESGSQGGQQGGGSQDGGN